MSLKFKRPARSMLSRSFQPRSPLRILICVLFISAVDVRGGLAETSAKSTTWAILIGVEKYQNAPPLPYTANDVKQLSQALINRGGVQRDQILEITDRNSAAEFQPMKQQLESQLTSWLKRPAASDSVIVYFSGHGFRDPEGKLYLAPSDCDPRQPASTGVSVDWFRSQLAECSAEFKLLILDSCHAGAEKGDNVSSVPANEIGSHFEDLEGVVTLASSKASEKSLIWMEREQSLFSYWLVQGLRGAADREPDGAIDIHELYEFVSENVKRSAQRRFGRSQTPVRIVRTGIDGVPKVLTLKPQTLKSLLSDVAGQVALAMEERKLSKVGVLEFLTQSLSGDEQLGADFGLLGKYCANELERQLQQHSSAGFSVVERRRLNEVLREQQFALADLGSTRKLATLSKSLDGTPVLAIGTLLGRHGRFLRLQCKLQQTNDDADLGVSIGGIVQLSDSEWAMLGRSAVVRPQDRRPEASVSHTTHQSAESTIVDRLDERVESPSSTHPLQDPSCPFNVWLRINGQKRVGGFRGNDLLIPVRKGEKYQIVVENRSGDVALMRLLVDGLNTLPESESAHEKGIKTVQWAQRVNLNDARPWVLDPKDPDLKGRGPNWTVAGFVTTTGAEGKLREFIVVDANESLAARQNFAEETGLITAAFYKPKTNSRGAVGTGAGTEVAESLVETTGMTAGNLMSVIHLRYVDANSMPVTQ